VEIVPIVLVLLVLAGAVTLAVIQLQKEAREQGRQDTKRDILAETETAERVIRDNAEKIRKNPDDIDDSKYR